MTKVVYIMGHGYSGSTLLTFLLSTHPQVATIGELGIAPLAKEDLTPQDYLCSCKTPVRDCGFWRTVSKEMAGRGHDFDIWDAGLEFRAPGRGVADVLLRAVQRGPVLETARDVGLRLVPAARREMERVISRISSLTEIVARLKGTDTFLDSSKRPERATLMQRSGNFDMRVIHLVRDGRAVSWSSMKHLKIGPEAAARSWLADNGGSEHARRYFPADRWMTLRYEDLCADPDATLRKIHGFMDIPSRNSFHNFRAVDHHIIGNQMRLASTSEIRLDESWKKALTPEQMAAIDRLVAPLNRRYGYGDV
ncbi:MAG: sulfotransferase family protein [Thermoanaerobaculia bacterium]